MMISFIQQRCTEMRCDPSSRIHNRKSLLYKSYGERVAVRVHICAASRVTYRSRIGVKRFNNSAINILSKNHFCLFLIRNQSPRLDPLILFYLFRSFHCQRFIRCPVSASLYDAAKSLYQSRQQHDLKLWKLFNVKVTDVSKQSDS